jgi:N-acetyl-anhydromuramyl-L-alanine amidase AmpD
VAARGNQPQRALRLTCPFRFRRTVSAPARPIIIKRILPQSSWGYGRTDREGLPIRFIVNHVAEGNGSLYGYFASKQLSTHYWVSKSGVIEQYVPDTGAAYAQGAVTSGSAFPPEYPGYGPAYNQMALSIEREGFITEEPTAIQWQRIVELNRWLAYLWNVPVDTDHIVAHARTDHINRANCPSSPSLSAAAYMNRLVSEVRQ